MGHHHHQGFSSHKKTEYEKGSEQGSIAEDQEDKDGAIVVVDDKSKKTKKLFLDMLRSLEARRQDKHDNNEDTSFINNHIKGMEQFMRDTKAGMEALKTGARAPIKAKRPRKCLRTLKQGPYNLALVPKEASAKRAAEDPVEGHPTKRSLITN